MLTLSRSRNATLEQFVNWVSGALFVVSTVLLLPGMLRTLPGWGGRGVVSRKLGP